MTLPVLFDTPVCKDLIDEIEPHETLCFIDERLCFPDEEAPCWHKVIISDTKPELMTSPNAYSSH